MKNIVFLIILILSFSSCKSSKQSKSKKKALTQVVTKKDKNTDTKNLYPVVNEVSDKRDLPKSKAEEIIEYAIQFEGVRYKWGGTTKTGMDCSGLVYESFRAHDVLLPRISRDMAKRGHKIALKDVTKGDLLFFKTGNRRNAINHVGLIIDIRDNNIAFIHATSNNGVVTSWLNEEYWLKAFTEARRIL